MNQRTTRVLAGLITVMLGFAAVASGCGHKGPLYLPDDDTAKKEQKQEKSGQY